MTRRGFFGVVAGSMFGRVAPKPRGVILHGREIVIPLSAMKLAAKDIATCMDRVIFNHRAWNMK
jgi:hypothetical protein